jgi:uncharacterized protein with GYD domain
MAKFVLHMTVTPYGTQHVDQLPQEMAAFQARVEELKGVVESAYFTMGTHDAVAVVDLADSELAMLLAVWVNQRGFFTTTTSPAWDTKSYQMILSKK